MWCFKRFISKEGDLIVRDLKEDFKNRALDKKRLIHYGFQEKNNCYYYRELLWNEQFQIQLELSNHQKNAKLIDLEEQEEYILVDVKDATGTFSKQLKEIYEAKIAEIIEKCSTIVIPHMNQTQDVISYIAKQYGDTLEYLWKDDWNNAVWRDKYSHKWYAVLLNIEANKLGLSSHDKIEVIDLKLEKDKIGKMIDYQTIFPGYHMNKNHWITIHLNGSMPNETLFSLIDNSYQLTQEKRRNKNVRK